MLEVIEKEKERVAKLKSSKKQLKRKADSPPAGDGESENITQEELEEQQAEEQESRENAIRSLRGRSARKSHVNKGKQ